VLFEENKDIHGIWNRLDKLITGCQRQGSVEELEKEGLPKGQGSFALSDIVSVVEGASHIKRARDLFGRVFAGSGQVTTTCL
jgi:hypothetical protein